MNLTDSHQISLSNPLVHGAVFHPPISLSLEKNTRHIDERLAQELTVFLHIKGMRSKDTKRRYTKELEKFFTWLNFAKYTKLDEIVLIHYQQALLTPPSELNSFSEINFHPTKPETVDQYLEPIRSFLNHLTTKGLLSYNPAKLVPPIGIRTTSQPPITRSFTSTQWQAVIDTLDNMPRNTPGESNRAERLRYCILVGYGLALRIREQALHTTKDLISRDNNYFIQIIGKGYRARTLPLQSLDTIVFDAILRYKEFLKLTSPANELALPLLPRLKPTYTTGKGKKKEVHLHEKGISPKTWEEQFKQFLQHDVMHYLNPHNPSSQSKTFENEWSHLTPHSLRHTRITHLVLQRKDLLWVQSFAGHEKLDTTRRYFHWSPTDD